MVKKPKAPRSIRIDDFMEQELLEIAKAEDRSVNYIIKKAIETYIENYKPRRAQKQK